jgi:hypothetical protein
MHRYYYLGPLVHSFLFVGYLSGFYISILVRFS